MGHLLSQREAARVWSVSRGHIQRCIASGKLSITGEKLIDPAEMVRVFGEPKRSEPDMGHPLEPGSATVEPRPDPAQLAKIAVLEATLMARDREVALLSANLEDMRAQVRLLTHDAKGPNRRRWWQFGR